MNDECMCHVSCVMCHVSKTKHATATSAPGLQGTSTTLLSQTLKGLLMGDGGTTYMYIVCINVMYIYISTSHTGHVDG